MFSRSAVHNTMTGCKVSLKVLPIALSMVCLSVLWTPTAALGDDIHTAVRSGNVDEVRKIIAADRESLLSTDRRLRTPLHWAAAEGNVELMELVFHPSTLEARNILNQTPIYPAIAGRHKAAIQWLLDRGARLDVETRVEGSSPLHLAVELGFADVVDMLLARGADIKKQNRPGSTPLIVAAKAGSCHLIDTLIARGNDPNAVNRAKASALIMAASQGHDECVRILLEKKVDLDKQSLSGQTALHFAAKRGDIDSVRRLLEAGAKTGLEDYRGRTPLSLAEEGGYREVVALLKEHIETESE